MSLALSAGVIKGCLGVAIGDDAGCLYNDSASRVGDIRRG